MLRLRVNDVEVEAEVEETGVVVEGKRGEFDSSQTNMSVKFSWRARLKSEALAGAGVEAGRKGRVTLRENAVPVFDAEVIFGHPAMVPGNEFAMDLESSAMLLLGPNCPKTRAFAAKAVNAMLGEEPDWVRHYRGHRGSCCVCGLSQAVLHDKELSACADCARSLSEDATDEERAAADRWSRIDERETERWKLLA